MIQDGCSWAFCCWAPSSTSHTLLQAGVHHRVSSDSELQELVAKQSDHALALAPNPSLYLEQHYFQGCCTHALLQAKQTGCRKFRHVNMQVPPSLPKQGMRSAYPT